jgi:hypothetical protein
MENTTTATPTPAPPPTPAPSPAPAPMPQMAEGGSTERSSGFVDTIKNLNWVEVGFGILGATALFYAIYYFRYNINNHKNFVKNIEGKVDDLHIKIADVNSSVAQKQQQQQSLDVFI